MEGIEKARGLFEAAGLAFLAVPEVLSALLVERDEWVFSTQPLRVSPYSLDVCIEGDEEASTGDYAILAHSGHGRNSHAI